MVLGRLHALVAVVAALAVSSGVLAGCSALDVGDPGASVRPASETAVAPRSGGRLVYGLQADPNGLDPTRNAWDAVGIQLANALYDPMMAYDADGVPQPYLLESLSPSQDFRTWTVRLRPGVRFSNGEPLDAAALAAFLEALRVSLVTGPPASAVAGVQVVDNLTLRIATLRPWASLAALLTGQGGYVVSPRQLTDPRGSEVPIGTGPFLLQSWQIDERFDLVKNPNYWRAGLPHLDSVQFLVVPDGRARIEMLQRGDLDASAFNFEWDINELERSVARSGTRGSLVVERDLGDAEKDTILFNTSKPPFDDKRIREAVAHAIDLKALGEINGWSRERVPKGPISPLSPYFQPAEYPAFDLERAKALVREYQQSKRLKEVAFTLTVASQPHAQLLVDQLAKAGLKVTLDNIDLKQLARYAVIGKYDAMQFRYFIAPDPDVLWHFFVRDSIKSSGISLNFAQYGDPRIDDALNDGRGTADVAKRKEAYGRFQQAMADDLPYVWLNQSEWRIATTTHVRDARNVTLPGGRKAMPHLAGTQRLTETWIDASR